MCNCPSCNHYCSINDIYYCTTCKSRYCITCRSIYVIHNNKFVLFLSTSQRPECDMYCEQCANYISKQDIYERSDTYESEFNYLIEDIQRSLNKFFKKYEELKRFDRLNK